jgi:hypothetical protein
VQKHTANRLAPGRSKRRINASPDNQVNRLCGKKRFAACALPVAFRQRLQWQYRKIETGGLISKRTAPHKQLPVRVFCCMPAPFSN